MLRTLLLVGCFAGGWIFPELHRFDWTMPLFLFYMLAVVFVRMDFNRHAISWRHFVVIAANIAIPFGLWGGMLLSGVPERFAQAAFFTAITPTASAAPIIISLLGGSITFAASGFLLSALCISAVLPVAVPLVLHQPIGDALWMIAGRVVFVTLLPLSLAIFARSRWGEKARAVGVFLTGSTLYTWMILVMIIAASASHFIHTNTVGITHSDVVWVAVIDLAICVFCFAVGALLGWPNHRRECSQLLGQKNTSYTTYLAISCGDPFVALGPAFYVFFHNAWNGIQLIFHKDDSAHEPQK
ncbi:MAG: hypothetical protein RR268_02215 [Kiritimatiellia bacterium]